MFDAASKRSWYDGSEDSPEQTRASEQAPSEQSTSPEQLTLAPSTASQPVSPDGAAAHTACAADVAVRITFVADCKKRYTAQELSSDHTVMSSHQAQTWPPVFRAAAFPVTASPAHAASSFPERPQTCCGVSRLPCALSRLLLQQPSRMLSPLSKVSRSARSGSGYRGAHPRPVLGQQAGASLVHPASRRLGVQLPRQPSSRTSGLYGARSSCSTQLRGTATLLVWS